MNHNEEKETLLTAIADFNFNCHDAIEQHQIIYEGYLFNCAENEINLSEDIILYNRYILQLLNLIKHQQKTEAQLN